MRKRANLLGGGIGVVNGRDGRVIDHGVAVGIRVVRKRDIVIVIEMSVGEEMRMMSEVGTDIDTGRDHGHGVGIGSIGLETKIAVGGHDEMSVDEVAAGLPERNAGETEIETVAGGIEIEIERHCL